MQRSISIAGRLHGIRKWRDTDTVVAPFLFCNRYGQP